MSISLVSQTPLGCNLYLMSLVLHVYIGLLNRTKAPDENFKLHFWVAKLLVNVTPKQALLGGYIALENSSSMVMKFMLI